MIERIFISSVQKELAAERRAIRDFVRGDPLLHRFFDVFLFEHLPATDRRADTAFLDEVRKAALYVGVFGYEYGTVRDDELSPTEIEFDEATAQGITRLIFVKGSEDATRHPRLRALIVRTGEQLISATLF